MRLIKLALLSVAGLFTVVLLISLLLPSTVRISRAIDIDAPAGNVFPLISDIGRWQEWNEYLRNYQPVKVTPLQFIAPDISISISSRDSNLVTASWKPSSAMLFQSGYALYGSNSRHLTCTLQWYFSFHVRWYPWEKFQSIVYDQQLGPVMERSLVKLKEIAENVK